MDPLALVQALPQAPQWLLLVCSEASQPLVTSLSQSSKSGSQLMEHVLAEQVGKPLLLEQAAPQALQWAALLVMLVSQPLVGLSSQSP